MLVYHGPKSWNRTAEKNSSAERSIGYRSLNYSYKDFLINPLRFFYILFKARIINIYAGYSFIPISPNWHWLYARLGGLDIYLLKLLRKKIVLHFQGCEIRNRYHNPAPAVCYLCEMKEQFCSVRRATGRRNKLIKLIDLADAVCVSTPDLAPFIDKKKVYFIPKISYDHPPEIAKEFGISDKLKIIHAPSHRSKKGTDTIVSVVNTKNPTVHAMKNFSGPFFTCFRNETNERYIPNPTNK